MAPKMQAKWKAYRQVNRHVAFKELKPIRIVPLNVLKSVQFGERPVVRQTTTEVEVQVLTDMEHLSHDGRIKTFMMGGRPHDQKVLQWCLKQ